MSRYVAILRFAPLLLLFPNSMYADCVKDYRSVKTGGVMITDVMITGTQNLSSDTLTDITSQLTGSCFDDDSEEPEERILALFRDRGYFAAELKNLTIKPGDPLANPKPAVLEAEVVEGTRFRLREIKVTGNHAFTTKNILGQFSLHKGDIFERNRIASGLEGMRGLYSPAGYLTMFIVPETQNLSDGTIILTLNVTEGPQYRMNKLDVFARKEMADKLRAAWSLPEGAVFDPEYIDHYISDNRSLLPADFGRERIQVVRNCPDGLVDVRILIDATDPKAQEPVKNIPCKKEDVQVQPE